MKTLTLACLASLIALPAMAERNPPPKPSGVTIHLFGPEFITGTGSAPASSSGGAPATPSSGDQGVTMNGSPAPLPAGSASSKSASGDSSASGPLMPPAQPEPTLSQVLHEMFVTGAPGQNNRPHLSREKRDYH